MKYLIKENEKAWVVTASNNEEATNWAIRNLDMSKEINISVWDGKITSEIIETQKGYKKLFT